MEIRLSFIQIKILLVGLLLLPNLAITKNTPKEFQDAYELSHEEILRRSKEILLESFEKIYDFNLFKDDRFCPKDRIALAHKDQQNAVIFICQDFYDYIDHIKSEVLRRNLRARELLAKNQNFDHHYVNIREVVMRFCVSVLVHEYLHLIDKIHGDEMYKHHDMIFQNANLENFFTSPHPEFSEWAEYQMSLPKQMR